jgi:hypothetical protein
MTNLCQFVTGLGAGPQGMKPIILRQAQDEAVRQDRSLMAGRPEGPSRTMAISAVFLSSSETGPETAPHIGREF